MRDQNGSSSPQRLNWSQPSLWDKWAEDSETRPNSKRKGKEKFPSTRPSNVNLPKGLVWAKYTACVIIEEQTCNCLLDTGSQVTTVSQSFYEDNLPNLEIHPLNELLEVEAANCQTVPYSGFIEVDITFPKNCFGSQDYCADTSIRLPGKNPTVIPAGESCIIEAIAHVNSQASDRWVVVDYQTLSPLPGGMLVTSCLLSLPDNPSKKLPVVMCNESKHDIILPAKSVIAEEYALQEVVQNKHRTSNTAQQGR